MDFFHKIRYTVRYGNRKICVMQNMGVIMSKKTKKVLKSLGMVTQIGISMLTPIAISGFIGYEIDKYLHTQYAFLGMLVLGIGAAFRSVYMITKPFYASDMKAEHERLQYMEDLKSGKESDE